MDMLQKGEVQEKGQKRNMNCATYRGKKTGVYYGSELLDCATCLLIEGKKRGKLPGPNPLKNPRYVHEMYAICMQSVGKLHKAKGGKPNPEGKAENLRTSFGAEVRNLVVIRYGCFWVFFFGCYLVLWCKTTNVCHFSR